MLKVWIKIKYFTIYAWYSLQILLIKIKYNVDNLKNKVIIKKNLKKVLTIQFSDGIVILVLKEREKQKKKTLKNKLTRKNNFDKLKEVKKQRRHSRLRNEL